MLAFFALDILLNFNTSYYNEGLIVTDRLKITFRYLKFWFWVDLVSTFPFEYAFLGVNN